MDKAKAKVGEFLHRSDKHDTSVHEHVKPAVTHETIKPHEHTNETTAVDREVHQDHHHTSVQPLQDRNALPEQHHIREGEVRSTEHSHGNDRDVQARLQQERDQHRDTRTVQDTTASRDEQGVVTGEHRHHHVHEAIQPVIHRETVEPHVVHSVNKVHEKHNAAPQVHGSSTLPSMSLDEFKGQGGTLTGRGERTDGFRGEPRHIGHDLSGHGSAHPDSAARVSGTDRTGTRRSRSRSSSDERRGPGSGVGRTGGGLTGSGAGHTGTGSGLSGSGSGLTGSGPGHAGTGHTGTGSGLTGSGPGHTGTGSGLTGSGAGHGPGTTGGKPSLKDKLNPKVDADGDGKPGFMS